MKPNDTYQAEVKVVKVRRGEATVVLVDGKRYVMEKNR